MRSNSFKYPLNDLGFSRGLSRFELRELRYHLKVISSLSLAVILRLEGIVDNLWITSSFRG